MRELDVFPAGEAIKGNKSCEYCAYSTGDEFMQDRFQGRFEESDGLLQVFGLYCLLNVFFIFLFIIPKSGGISRYNLAKNQRFLSRRPR
jgi:hypothetical protein